MPTPSQAADRTDLKVRRPPKCILIVLGAAGIGMANDVGLWDILARIATGITLLGYCIVLVRVAKTQVHKLLTVSDFHARKGMTWYSVVKQEFFKSWKDALTYLVIFIYILVGASSFTIVICIAVQFILFGTFDVTAIIVGIVLGFIIAIYAMLELILHTPPYESHG